MKIFTNFNTEFCAKMLSEKKKEFGDENVFVIKRSKFFWYFGGVIPIVIILTLMGFGTLILLKYQIGYIYIIILMIFCLILIWKIVFHKFLRYKLDFAIVSPKGIFTYKQRGIFNSGFKEISSSKIKTIQVSNRNLMGNIFGYGTIEVISDGAEIEVTHKETSGMIRLAFVDSHYKIKEKITKICF